MEIIEVMNTDDIPTDFTGLVRNCNGEEFRYVNGHLHCDDGPAVVCPSGTRFWYQNGQRHRANGPAVEYPFKKEWWLNGQKVSQETVESL